jgi:hypothetical protein
MSYTNLSQDNYGKMGSENAHRVVRLFKDLGLVEEYRKYEMDLYKGILHRISKLPDSIPTLFFAETLDIIIKREK